MLFILKKGSLTFRKKPENRTATIERTSNKPILVGSKETCYRPDEMHKPL